jgi:hypothetical protein
LAAKAPLQKPTKLSSVATNIALKAARELEWDESESAFDAGLKKIASAQAPKKRKKRA